MHTVIFSVQSRNLQELNRSCVVHMFKNYKDPNQQSSSPCETVHDLSIPMIAVGALDDPFSPADSKVIYCRSINNIGEDGARLNVSFEDN